MDPITIIAALLPVGVEAAKAAVQRWLAPDEVKPIDFGQALELKRLDVELFRTIQAAEGNGATWPWVEAVRKLQRPVVIGGILGVWAWLHLAGGDTAAVDTMLQAVGFYLFGDRTLFYVRRARP